MWLAHSSLIIFWSSAASLDQKALAICGMYWPMNWWSAYENFTPASHSLAELTLSSVLTKASNVPWLSASGTLGQAVVLAMPPANLMRQEMPAPPGLRILSPFSDEKFESAVFVAYQFWKPRSIHGPRMWVLSLAAICSLTW